MGIVAYKMPHLSIALRITCNDQKALRYPFQLAAIGLKFPKKLHHAPPYAPAFSEVNVVDR